MRIVCIAVLLLHFPAIALAHMSYYEASRPIALPNGRSGEMRVVHGDGIHWPDPTWPVVVDQGGHLIAWGGAATGHVVLCSRGSCVAAEVAGRCPGRCGWRPGWSGCGSAGGAGVGWASPSQAKPCTEDLDLAHEKSLAAALAPASGLTAPCSHFKLTTATCEWEYDA